MRIIGVDPGISGGVCFLKGSDIRAAIKMPTVDYTVGTGKKTKKKKMVDAVALGELFKHFNPDAIFIEKVGAMPGQGVTSMFNFGLATGIVHGIAGAVGIVPELVRPQVWKGVILDGTEKDKDAAIGFCEQNFPNTDLRPTQRSKKPHDGTADAICIACYGLYVMQNNINTQDGDDDEGNL